MSTDFSDLFFGNLAEHYGLRENALTEDRAIADSIRASLVLPPLEPDGPPLRHQLDVLEDPCRRKAVLCPRRAGKSYMAMSGAYDKALRKPGARVVIVNLTLRNAKDVYWYEMALFANKFGIQAKFYQNELRTVLPNSSQILLTSADSRAEIEKLRGGQYDLVIIDECKSYPAPLLHELIYEVVMPALADRKGTIMMVGTPGNILSGPFFQATYPGYRGEPTKTHPEGKLFARDYHEPEDYWVKHPKDKLYWSRHHWTVQENTAQRHVWNEFLEQKEAAGWSDDEPIWRREALGEWISTGDAFVYAYANLASTDPALVHWTPDYIAGNKFGLSRDEDWRYLLGIDWGFEDAFAMVVVAYNKHDGKLYHVWDKQETHLDAYEVIDEVDLAVSRFGKFDAVVAEYASGGKTIIEALNKRHGMNIKLAEKNAKFDFIELLNADFRAGRLLIQPGSDLAFQLATLQFDLSKGSKEQLARAGKLREAPSLPNDLCDALLYVWRFSYHYYADLRPSLFVPGTTEWYREHEAKAMKAAVEKRAMSAMEPEWRKWMKPRDPLRDFYAIN